LATVPGLVGVAALASQLLGLRPDLAAVGGPLFGPDALPPPSAAAVSCSLIALSVTLLLTRARLSWADDIRQFARLLGLCASVFALALHAFKPGIIEAVHGFATFRVTTALALTLMLLAVGFDRPILSLRWQVAHLGVLVIAPLAWLTVHFASVEREAELEAATGRLNGALRLAVEQQNGVIEEARKLLIFLARLPDVRQGGEACDRRLSDFSRLNPSAQAFFVISSDLKVICSDLSAARGVDVSDRDYVHRAFAHGGVAVSGLVMARVSGMPRIALAMPIRTETGRQIALGVTLSLSALSGPLERLAAEIDPRATVTLVDAAGLVIARHPVAPFLVGRSLAGETMWTTAIRDGDGVFEARELGGQDTIFVTRPVIEEQARLIVGLPKRDVVATIDQRMNQRLGAISLILLASVALGVLGGEVLVLRPLRRLTAYARRLETGETAARPEMTARGEVGALGRALAVMAEAVEDRERRLAGAEALFRGLFDHSPDPAAVLRVDGKGGFRFEAWNAAAQRFTGLSLPEVLGRRPTEVFPGSRGESIERDLDRVAQLGRVLRVEREPAAQGVVVTFEMVLAPFQAGDGRIDLIFATARDISDRKRVERLKNEFVSTVSHELRTPLTSIAGSLGLLSGGAAGPIGDRARHLVGIAHANSLRLVRLINDILDIEKIEAGRMAFDLKALDLLDVAGQAVTGLRAYADSFGVDVELVSTGEPVVVFGDQDRLTQVVTNLVSNAIKFSPAGGAVIVAVGADGETAAIRVRDSGPGVPEAFLPRMFTKFAQADGSDSRRKGGTGLGLAIVKEIVERHAGAIRYRENGGAEFEVRLPRVGRAADEAPAETAAAPRSRPRVLICEDDPFTATLLGELLKDAGFDSLAVRSVREAREAAFKPDIEALLVDLNLPDGDEITLIHDIQASARSRDLPVVVVSASAAQGRADARAANLKVTEWLEKPIDPARLASVLKQSLAAARPKPRILHVEDDEDLSRVVAAAVGGLADVTFAGGLAAARARLARERYDLIILDLALKDGSGLDLMADLKASPHPAPTILFSAHDVDEKVAPFEAAARLTKSRSSLAALVATVERMLGADRAPFPKAG
ncbi:ATP-binding protein, partial [Methylopila musalis]